MTSRLPPRPASVFSSGSAASTGRVGGSSSISAGAAAGVLPLPLPLAALVKERLFGVRLGFG